MMKTTIRPSSGKHLPTTNHNPASVALLVHGGKLAAWQTLPGQQPKPLLIKAEHQLIVHDAQTLASAYADLDERLRGDGTRMAITHWVADADGRQWCTAAGLAEWQLPWEWLVQRFDLGNAAPWDALETLQAKILPWLMTADDAAQRAQLQQAREDRHASETERLAAERASLAQDNERLRAQNTALQQVDAERLISFLPALYARVFTMLGATDLALLCGQVAPLDLPNPYPEPSEETLRTLQKRFRALPQSLQRQIVGFVTGLPQGQKLKPRPEMRDLIEEL